MKNDAQKRFWRRTVYAALFLLFLLFLYAPRPLSIEEEFQVHSGLGYLLPHDKSLGS